MKKGQLEKITGRGYWRINFQPLTSKEKITLEQCSEIIRKNAVRLRGWDYPHFPQRQEDDTGLESTQNYYQGWIDWWAHKEFWRMYKSGQFLHYIALNEDWYEEDGWFAELAKKNPPMTTLNIIGAVEYQVAEIFEFLSRLASEGIYDEGVAVSITLHNIQNRKLRIDDPMRVPLHSDRKTAANEYIFQQKFQKNEVTGKAKELSLKISLEIFNIFGWHNPPLATIDRDIGEFLSGQRN